MRLRKLLIVLLALLVVFSLAGCGGSGGGGDDDNGGSNGDNGGNGGDNGGSGGDDDTPVVIPDDFVKVNGGTVSGQVADSHIFIEGRTVQIRDMYVCNHEVTQKEFKQYMKLYEWNTSIGGDYHSESQGSSGMGDNYPVFWTSWYSAVMYCNLRSIEEGLTPVYYITIDGKKETDIGKWFHKRNEWKTENGIIYFGYEDNKYYYCGADQGGDYGAICGDITPNMDLEANGYRLPTEVEWEYIARGGNNGIPNVQYTYSGSDNPVGYVAGDGAVSPTGFEIETKNPNTLGIYDMSGNAYEWVWDWFNDISASTPATGPEATKQDSLGRLAGRTIRGGGHNISYTGCKVDSRSYSMPGDLNGNVYDPGSGAGFRVVRNAD